ncbi:hypothetical protein MTO96_013559 [Rhipicephalus appendiculatus]
MKAARGTRRETHLRTVLLCVGGARCRVPARNIGHLMSHSSGLLELFEHHHALVRWRWQYHVLVGWRWGPRRSGTALSEPRRGGVHVRAADGGHTDDESRTPLSPGGALGTRLRTGGDCAM